MRALPITISLLLICAAAGPIGVADNAEFKPFTSKEGKFTISMPGKPEVSTSTIKAPTGDMELHTAQAARGKNKELYTVAYNEVPAEVIKGGDSDKILDSARDGGVEITRGKLTKETKTAKTDKTPASRDLEIDIQGTTAYYRMLLVGNRLYVIMAYTDGTKGSADRAKLFLDSFKLAKDEPATSGKR